MRSPGRRALSASVVSWCAAFGVGCEDPPSGERAAPVVDAAAGDASLDPSPGDAVSPVTTSDAGKRTPSERPAHPSPGSDAGDPRPSTIDSGPDALIPVDAGPIPGSVDAGTAPLPLDCRAGTPALAFDVVAMVRGRALVLRSLHSADERTATAWGTAFRPTRPVAFGDVERPGFALTLANGSSCRVRAVDKDGAALWETEREAESCGPLAVSQDGLWLPIAHADGTGVLELLAAGDGSAIRTASLPSRPTTALAALGGGGGSHWIAGSERGLFLIRTDAGAPSVTASDSDELGPVQDLAVYASDRVVLASRSALGRYRVDVDTNSVESLGSPIVTRGPITSNLVASLDCGDRAGGATHYFCETGLVAAGGAGWLSAWRLDDGEPWFDVSVSDTLHGVALLADGALHGGGSHWTGGEGGVTLYAVADPEAPLDVVHASDVSEESCVGSPVVDTNGELGLAVAGRTDGELVTLETRAPGLASGWSRAAGENGSRGTVGSGELACEAGDQRLFQRYAGPELTRATDLALLPDGSFVVAGAGEGAMLAGFSPAGVQAWSHSAAPPLLQFDQVVSAADRLFAFTTSGSEIAITALDTDGSVLLERNEPASGLAGLLDAHALGDDRVALVAALASTDALAADARIYVFDADGVLESTGDLIDPALLSPTASALVPGTSDLVLTGSLSGAGAFVVRVALDGSVVWYDSVATARADLTGVDVVAHENGEVTAAFANGPHTLLHRYDSLGARELGTPAAFVVPRALASGPFGTWLLDQSGGIARVLDPLALAAARPPAAGPAQNGIALETTGTGALLVANATEADGSGSVYLAQLDGQARSGCAEAGLCVSSASCADDGACRAGVCEPSSGVCSTEPLPEFTSCGDGNVCSLGTCGPVVDAPRTVEASACYDVASYAECVPASLVYATLVLHPDGTIDTMDPGTTGTWREPAGPDSIEFVFRDAMTQDVVSTFTGQLAFDRCWEGTIELADTSSGGFRACGT